MACSQKDPASRFYVNLNIRFYVDQFREYFRTWNVLERMV